MSMKKTRYARVIFSCMVPLTILAFALATLTESGILMGAPDMLDIMALIVVALGVWMYNWFEEKPHKASIENL